MAWWFFSKFRYGIPPRNMIDVCSLSCYEVIFKIWGKFINHILLFCDYLEQEHVKLLTFWKFIQTFERWRRQTTEKFFFSFEFEIFTVFIFLTFVWWRKKVEFIILEVLSQISKKFGFFEEKIFIFQEDMTKVFQFNMTKFTFHPIKFHESFSISDKFSSNKLPFIPNFSSLEASLLTTSTNWTALIEMIISQYDRKWKT